MLHFFISRKLYYSLFSDIHIHSFVQFSYSFICMFFIFIHLFFAFLPNLSFFNCPVVFFKKWTHFTFNSFTFIFFTSVLKIFSLFFSLLLFSQVFLPFSYVSLQLFLLGVSSPLLFHLVKLAF